MVDEDLENKIKLALEQSNIPPVIWAKTLLDFGSTGKSLRAYLRSDSYSSDVAEGIGMVVSSNSKQKVGLFQTFCKELALLGDSIYLVSLQTLAKALMTDNSGDFLYQLDRVRSLCVSYFYDSSIDTCPYSFKERAAIEDYLRDKILFNNRVYLSSTDTALSMDWWSMDFRREVAEYSRDMVVWNG